MRATLLILLAAIVAACGNKGDLYLRDPTAPPPMTAADHAAAKAAAQADAAESRDAEAAQEARRRRDD